MKTLSTTFIGMIAVLFSATVLTGCASLNSNFDCPMKPGVMCESIDQVNTQVDQGVLGGNSTTGACKNCSTLTAGQVNTKGDFTTPYPSIAQSPGDPLRYGETVMRIWLAPYEDKEGNYYQPTVLYTVIKPGHWIGQPVKAITDDGDDA